MDDNKKEFIIKLVIVLGAIGMFGVFLLVVPRYMFEEYIFIEVAYIVFWIMWAVFGVILIILINIWSDIKPKPVKAEKYKCLFEEFEELRIFLDKTLQKRGFVEMEYDIPQRIVTKLYIRSNKKNWTDYFCVIRLDEWNSESEECVNEELENVIGEHFTGLKKIRIITVICVNRITPAFQKLVNGNIRQERNLFKLPVGISFGGKQIYIAKQKEGIAIMQYKKLRKEFLEILNLPIN